MKLTCDKAAFPDAELLDDYGVFYDADGVLTEPYLLYVDTESGLCIAARKDADGRWIMNPVREDNLNRNRQHFVTHHKPPLTFKSFKDNPGLREQCA